MTASAAEPQHLTPLDPESPAGKAAAQGLAELFDDVADRLRREGKPVPGCLLGGESA